jgi:hypothetical protein
MINDFKNQTLTQQLIAPQLLTATTTNGTGVDMLQGDGNCWLELAIGTFNATSISVQVQESAATNSGFTDITGAVAAATTAQSNSVVKSNTFQRNLRYLRCIATVSGTTIGCSAVLGESIKQL